MAINMRDFTLGKYEEICRAVKKNYPVVTFDQYLNVSKGRLVILRHDVDRLPKNALSMAKLEHDLGLKATYYFRAKKSSFNPEIIKKIASLGHEIGYHYECLDESRGDHRQAIKIFQDHLIKLRRLAPIKTICMHGNPLSKFDNRDLWQKYNYKDYAILGEAYLSLRDNVAYFSDTGRTWDNRYKIKDHLLHSMIKKENIKIKTSDDLIRLVGSKKIDQICILSHPERWNNNLIWWSGYFVIDKLVQVIKKVKISHENITGN